MTKRNAHSRPEFTVRLEKARKEISGSLSRAMAAVKCSQSAAARSMSITERTVRDWVHGITPVNVERVLASPKLASAFRQFLCVHDHEPLAYVAKKRSRSA